MKSGNISREELVMLTRHDYDALVALADQAAEDADDVAVYEARKMEIVPP